MLNSSKPSYNGKCFSLLILSGQWLWNGVQGLAGLGVKLIFFTEIMAKQRMSIELMILVKVLPKNLIQLPTLSQTCYNSVSLLVSMQWEGLSVKNKKINKKLNFPFVNLITFIFHIIFIKT